MKFLCLLANRKLLRKFQVGFQISSLQLVDDDWLQAPDKKQCTTDVFIDLSKSFDNVLQNWALSWHGRFGSAKTKMMTLLQNISPEHKTIHIENEAIKIVNSHKHLGLNLTADLDWHDDINPLLLGASQRAGLLRWMSKDFSSHHMRTVLTL